MTKAVTKEQIQEYYDYVCKVTRENPPKVIVRWCAKCQDVTAHEPFNCGICGSEPPPRTDFEKWKPSPEPKKP